MWLQSDKACSVQVPCRRVLETARAVVKRDKARGVATDDPVVERLAKSLPQNSESCSHSIYNFGIWGYAVHLTLDHLRPGMSTVPCSSMSWPSRSPSRRALWGASRITNGSSPRISYPSWTSLATLTSYLESSLLKK